MSSTSRFTFPAIALSLIFLLYCVLPARTTFASGNLRFAIGADDHSFASRFWQRWRNAGHSRDPRIARRFDAQSNRGHSEDQI